MPDKSKTRALASIQRIGDPRVADVSVECPVGLRVRMMRMRGLGARRNGRMEYAYLPRKAKPVASMDSRY